jgi:hypothetical protein
MRGRVVLFNGCCLFVENLVWNLWHQAFTIMIFLLMGMLVGGNKNIRMVA